jgi:hypothetical protein
MNPSTGFGLMGVYAGREAQGMKEKADRRTVSPILGSAEMICQVQGHMLQPLRVAAHRGSHITHSVANPLDSPSKTQEIHGSHGSPLRWKARRPRHLRMFRPALPGWPVRAGFGTTFAQ